MCADHSTRLRCRPQLSVVNSGNHFLQRHAQWAFFDLGRRLGSFNPKRSARPSDLEQGPRPFNSEHNPIPPDPEQSPSKHALCDEEQNLISFDRQRNAGFHFRVSLPFQEEPIPSTDTQNPKHLNVEENGLVEFSNLMAPGIGSLLYPHRDFTCIIYVYH